MADANLALTQFTTSAMIVAGLNWLKASPYFPWITKEKTALLRGISIVAATATSVGIGHVWNGAEHSLLITGLTGSAVLGFFWAIAKSFVMNETIFQATKRTSDPAVVQAVAPEAADPVIPKP